MTTSDPRDTTCRSLGAVLSSLMVLGCTGLINDGDRAAREREREPVNPAPAPLVCEDGVRRPGRSPMRRLTRSEFDATVRDLLGDDTKPAERLMDDERGVSLVEGRSMTPLLAEQYLTAAEDVAQRATADLSALLGCDSASEGCITRFIEDFGLRAWRRPLDASDVAELTAFYESFVEEAGEREATALLLERFLTSPHFLYRVELPARAETPGAVVPLDGWQRATRLSYTLWGTAPDTELLEAAASGELDDDDAVRRHAERMLRDPRAEPTLLGFFDHWLELELLEGLDKNPSVFPSWSSRIAALMRQETAAFVRAVVIEGDGSFETLLTASWSMMNEELATYYGLSGPTGDAFVRTERQAGHHAGLLTQGAFLAPRAHTYETSPIHRGMFIRGSLFCGDVPPVPEGLTVEAPDPDPSLTTRERLEEHRANPVCATCHVLMDPPGFAFEHFDGAGRFRTDEGGLPIDTTGELVATDVDGFFDGAADMARRAVDSEQARACFARQWFRHAYARTDVHEDGCAMQQLTSRFVESGLDVRALVLELTQTDAFLYRTVDDPTATLDEGGSR